jgi:predicted NBD/HSP70 family sugar kinase
VQALAVALGSALNVLDLPLVVLGGHLARLDDETVTLLEEQLAQRVASAPWGGVGVRRAPETVAAGATGAALSVLGDVLQDPLAYLPRTGQAG